MFNAEHDPYTSLGLQADGLGVRVLACGLGNCSREVRRPARPHSASQVAAKNSTGLLAAPRLL